MTTMIWDELPREIKRLIIAYCPSVRALLLVNREIHDIFVSLDYTKIKRRASDKLEIIDKFTTQTPKTGYNIVYFGQAIHLQHTYLLNSDNFQVTIDSAEMHFIYIENAPISVSYIYLNHEIVYNYEDGWFVEHDSYVVFTRLLRFIQGIFRGRIDIPAHNSINISKNIILFKARMIGIL